MQLRHIEPHFCIVKLRYSGMYYFFIFCSFVILMEIWFEYDRIAAFCNILLSNKYVP